MLFLVGKISSITKSLKCKLFIYSPSNYSFSGFIAKNYRALSHSWHHEIVSPYQKISFFPCYSWLNAIRNPIWSLDNRSHSTGCGALRLSLAGVKGWWPFLPFCWRLPSPVPRGYMRLRERQWNLHLPPHHNARMWAAHLVTSTFLFLLDSFLISAL